MVKIPYIKIPSVRVESIGPTSNIGTGGAAPAPPSPSPITYLTQWKIVGNSQVHGTEIWSCGEYNATDGKYHILVQPLGGSIADIALTEPLRKVNDVADTIEFPSDTEGKALVTRYLKSINLGSITTWNKRSTIKAGIFSTTDISDRKYASDIVGLCANYTQAPCIDDAILMKEATDKTFCFYFSTIQGTAAYIYDSDYATSTVDQFTLAMDGVELIYELKTPTTELVDAPQIAEADSYSCVISQGAKAVEWSSFETDSE